MTRFSVLIPTRNRLDLLKQAVATVLRQDFDNWELIVSDNCSEEDVQGYVKSLADSRVIYTRTASFVPVTENWNNALSKSTGDYIVMLGDDDGLFAGSLRRLDEIIRDFQAPDFIYTNALQFAYPNVIPGEPQAFTQRGYAFFFEQEHNSPWLMSRKVARRVVKRSFNFHLPCNYNMQNGIVSRKMIKQIERSGTFFDSPYPDYFAMNALFLKAKRIVINPTPLVFVGISPKSFGYFYFNNMEQEGNKFLNNALTERMRSRLKNVLLPGSEMINSWLAAMEAVAMRFGSVFGPRVNRRRYRTIQLALAHKELGDSGLVAFLPRLSWLERQVVGVCLWARRTAKRKLWFSQNWVWETYLRLWWPYPFYDPQKQHVGSRNLIEAFEEFQSSDPELSKPLRPIPKPESIRGVIKAYLKTRRKLRFKVGASSQVTLEYPKDWQTIESIKVQFRSKGKVGSFFADVSELNAQEQILHSFEVQKKRGRVFQGQLNSALQPGNYVVFLRSAEGQKFGAFGVTIRKENSL